MQVIVPLAGPDFATANGVKGKADIKGLPLIRRAIESRPWWLSGETTSSSLTFVLLDCPQARAFAAEDLAQWYPEARIVFISQATRGAALSALAGVALTGNVDAPLCIDLADILFDSHFEPAVLRSEGIGGAALTFTSHKSCYSYLRTDADGRFLEAAEKRTISRVASAGVYFFRSASVYLRALAYSLDHKESQTYNDLFYVCPVLNGVRDQNLTVVLETVDTVLDIKDMTAPSKI